MKKILLFIFFTFIFSCHDPHQISQKFSSLANIDSTRDLNIRLIKAYMNLAPFIVFFN